MMGKSGRKLHGQVGHSGTCNFLLKFLFYSQDFVADAPAIYIIFVFCPTFLFCGNLSYFLGGRGEERDLEMQTRNIPGKFVINGFDWLSKEV